MKRCAGPGIRITDTVTGLVFSNGHLTGIITPSDITRMIDRLGFHRSRNGRPAMEREPCLELMLGEPPYPCRSGCSGPQRDKHHDGTPGPADEGFRP